MQNVCGVKEQKIHIKILMKPYQLKSLSLKKKREIELCFFCYENELDFCNNNNISFKKILDDRFETLNLLKLV